jgi:hypothetical protein
MYVIKVINESRDPKTMSCFFLPFVCSVYCRRFTSERALSAAALNTPMYYMLGCLTLERALCIIVNIQYALEPTRAPRTMWANDISVSILKI